MTKVAFDTSRMANKQDVFNVHEVSGSTGNESEREKLEELSERFSELDSVRMYTLDVSAGDYSVFHNHSMVMCHFMEEHYCFLFNENSSIGGTSFVQVYCNKLAAKCLWHRKFHLNSELAQTKPQAPVGYYHVQKYYADVAGPYYSNLQMIQIQKSSNKELEGVVKTYVSEINFTNMRELFSLTKDVMKPSNTKDVIQDELSSSDRGNNKVATWIYWVSTVVDDSDGINNSNEFNQEKVSDDVFDDLKQTTIDKKVQASKGVKQVTRRASACLKMKEAGNQMRSDTQDCCALTNRNVSDSSKIETAKYKDLPLLTEEGEEAYVGSSGAPVQNTKGAISSNSPAGRRGKDVTSTEMNDHLKHPKEGRGKESSLKKRKKLFDDVEGYTMVLEGGTFSSIIFPTTNKVKEPANPVMKDMMRAQGVAPETSQKNLKMV